MTAAYIHKIILTREHRGKTKKGKCITPKIDGDQDQFHYEKVWQE